MVEFKEFNQNLFEAPRPFTGSKRIELDGWDTLIILNSSIEQDEPLPFHITALVMENNINER